MIKVCKICGKSFETNSARKICDAEHTRKCAVCQKEFKIDAKYVDRKTCSNECARILRKLNAEATCLAKYGIRNPGYCESSRIKIQQTCENRYGVKFAAQANSVKSKIIDTNMRKYGVTNPMMAAEVQDKMKHTNLIKYGAECVLSAESSIRSKIDQDMIDKYGTSGPGNTPSAIKKRKITNQLRYGVDFPMQNADIRGKSQSTCLSKYGSLYPVTSDEIKLSISRSVRDKYGVDSIMELPDIKHKVSQTVQSRYGVEWACQLPQCKTAGSAISKRNMEFSKKLLDNNISHIMEYNIADKSYDFLITGPQILIELDPTYTHSSVDVKPYGKIAKNYHKYKSQIALDHNMWCIHVFDWDDDQKIINMIAPKSFIGGRQCCIKEVAKCDADDFLNSYHLQNSCKSDSIRIGLYYHDELVQLMTFGQPRYNNDCQWELLRLCNKSGIGVIGGSHKIFNAFIKCYHPESIVSYCDYSKFKGDIYRDLGFKLKTINDPSIHWSKGHKQITDNLLRQLGYDQLFNTKYGKGTSNQQLMLDHNWLPVYDCGQITYEWRA